MNERIRELAEQSGCKVMDGEWYIPSATGLEKIVYTKGIGLEKFAELIVRECINREELLGAIARGWCSEKNSHKTMDSDLAVAIFDQVEQQIKQHFGFEE